MEPYYTDRAGAHRITRRTFALQYGESRWYEVDEILHLSEALARMAAKRRWAERVTTH
jgi:hypothetical protein